MPRYASLVVLAGVMSVTLHAQTPVVPQTPPPAPAKTALPTQAPPPAPPAQTALPVPVQTPPPSRPAPTPRASRPASAAPSATGVPFGSQAGRAPTQNVRVDLKITDGTGLRTADEGAVKVVTMLVADGNMGRIRSSNNLAEHAAGVPMPVVAALTRQILINVDAIPTVRSDGRIQLNLTVEYAPELSPADGSTPRPASINESLTVLVADGKPTLISQSADPATSRRVTVEVTATIVK